MSSRLKQGRLINPYVYVIASIILAVFLAVLGMMSVSAQTFTEGDYEYKINDDGNTVTIVEYTGARNIDLIIPDELDGKVVTKIGDNAFAYRYLTSVEIPKSVTEIGGWAFESNNLTSIDLPEGITVIKNHTFSNNNLESVVIPNSVIEIGGFAFDGNDLTTVEIPDGVKTIQDRAFFGNKLRSLVIPDNVEEIGFDAFADNELTSVKLSKGLTEIKNYTFENNHLTYVDIPGNIETIGESAFALNNLQSIDIGEGVKEIKAVAFYGNDLTYVVIPRSVEVIEHQAFSYNKQLSNFYVQNPYTVLEGTIFLQNFENRDESELTLWSYPRSTAYSYAQEHGYSFNILNDVFVDEAAIPIEPGMIVDILKGSIKVAELSIPTSFTPTHIASKMSQANLEVRTSTADVPSNLKVDGEVLEFIFTDISGNEFDVSGNFELSMRVNYQAEDPSIYHLNGNDEWTYVGGTINYPFITTTVNNFSNYGVFSPTEPPKEGVVVTKYVDEDGTEIAGRNQISGEIGANYKTTQKDIPGYEFVRVDGDPEGTYIDGEQIVIYIYKKLIDQPVDIEGTVITKYVDENGKEIAGRNEASGKVGEDYETKQKDIPGYEFMRVDGDSTGTYIEGLITVVYEYQKLDSIPTDIEGSVITKYVDENGTEIAGRNETSGVVGTNYTTDQKDIPGYAFVSVDGNATGQFIEGTITVIYVYKTIDQRDPVIEGTVITKYVDEDGTEIAERNEASGNVGADYTTKQKDISGYEFVRVDGAATGQYIEGIITVTYIYETIKQTDPVIEGTVIMKYVDEDGTEIAERNETSGKVGEDYTTVKKDISGYEFVRVEGDETGQYIEGTITVTYIYETIKQTDPVIEGTVITKYVDEDGTEIAERNETSGKVGEDYRTEQKDISGYDFIRVEGDAAGQYIEGTITVTYIYETIKQTDPVIEGTVITKYVDEDGAEIAEQNEISGAIGINYTTEQKDILGYEFVRVDGDSEGLITEETITVKYIYNKVEETTKPGDSKDPTDRTPKPSEPEETPGPSDDGKKDTSYSEDKQRDPEANYLPKTATTNFAVIFLGLVSIIIGSLLYMLHRRKKLNF